MLPYNDSSSGGPAITCLSPTRGMTPEVLLANDSGYYGGGGGSLSQAASPRQQVFAYLISQSWRCLKNFGSRVQIALTQNLGFSIHPSPLMLTAC